MVEKNTRDILDSPRKDGIGEKCIEQGRARGLINLRKLRNWWVG